MPLAYTPVLWNSGQVESLLGHDFEMISGPSTPWQATGVNRRPEIIQPGDLFVAADEEHEAALRASLPEIFAAGAVAAFVAGIAPPTPAWAPIYRVPDTKGVLERLGTHARERSEAKLVGVTGSVGKTGIKDALLRVLGCSGPTFATYRSANCSWGVPESLANLPQHAAFGVFEMGMLGPNSIESKTRRVRPHVALITAIAPAHLAYHGSIESIVETKADILHGLEPDGVFVAPRDSPYFERLDARSRECAAVGRRIYFGSDPGSDVRLVDASVGPTHSKVRADVLGREVKYIVGLGGAHWVYNSLAVLATCAALDIDIERCAAGLAGLVPSFRRGERFRVEIPGTGKVVELVDDSWNANPTSMGAALAQLAALTPAPRKGRRIAWLGDMLELGAEAEKAAHEALVEPLLEAKVDQVITVGQRMAALHAALPASIRGPYFSNAKTAAKKFPSLLRDGDIVLVKGSNGSEMWRMVHSVIPARKHVTSRPYTWTLAGERKAET